MLFKPRESILIDNILHYKCSFCEVFKPNTDFYSSKKTNRLFSHCKKCLSKRRKHKRQTDPNFRAREKQYRNYDKNKEKIIQNVRKFYKKPENRSKLLKYNKTSRERLKVDGKRRFIYNLRKSFKKSFDNSSIEKILCFSEENIIKLFEQSFSPEMNWDDYGSVWILGYKKGYERSYTNMIPVMANNLRKNKMEIKS